MPRPSHWDVCLGRRDGDRIDFCSCSRAGLPSFIIQLELVRKTSVVIVALTLKLKILSYQNIDIKFYVVHRRTLASGCPREGASCSGVRAQRELVNIDRLHLELCQNIQSTAQHHKHYPTTLLDLCIRDGRDLARTSTQSSFPMSL